MSSICAYSKSVACCDSIDVGFGRRPNRRRTLDPSVLEGEEGKRGGAVDDVGGDGGIARQVLIPAGSSGQVGTQFVRKCIVESVGSIQFETLPYSRLQL